ncbi:RNA polymerase sigma factor [Streptosporangium sp. NPDC050855]|uniref:RNA polymerase sigma factor n=1 Tax=Streptosporangium sp. NPDC050855 TaxID=3366194 RepID=UPI0037BC3A04
MQIAHHEILDEVFDEDLAVLQADLVIAWRRLRPEDQEVLSLAIWEDLPSPQAARVLGISAPAYRLRLHRARSALRRELKRPDPATRSVNHHVMKGTL